MDLSPRVISPDVCEVLLKDILEIEDYVFVELWLLESPKGKRNGKEGGRDYGGTSSQSSTDSNLPPLFPSYFISLTLLGLR